MVEFTPKSLMWLWPICTFFVILGSLYALIAATLLRQFAQKSAVARSGSSAVSVFKPLYGMEPELEANLTSFCQQNYGGQAQFIFGVQDQAFRRSSVRAFG